MFKFEKDLKNKEGVQAQKSESKRQTYSRQKDGHALPSNVKVGKPSDMAMAEDWAMHTLYWQPTHTQAPDTLQRRPSQMYIVLFTLYAHRTQSQML